MGKTLQASRKRETRKERTRFWGKISWNGSTIKRGGEESDLRGTNARMGKKKLQEKGGGRVLGWEKTYDTQQVNSGLREKRESWYIGLKI